MSKVAPKKLTQSTSELLAKVSRYKLILFVLFVAAVYGYIFFTINSLSSAIPNDTMVSEKSKPIKTTKIDKRVVLQLQQLQDNSVRVQTLFQEARDNPFQE